jgi:hypothetical protein
LDASNHLLDLDPTQSMNALIAGEIDVAIVPELDSIPSRRALDSDRPAFPCIGRVLAGGASTHAMTD